MNGGIGGIVKPLAFINGVISGVDATSKHKGGNNGRSAIISAFIVHGFNNITVATFNVFYQQLGAGVVGRPLIRITCFKHKLPCSGKNILQLCNIFLLGVAYG